MDSGDASWQRCAELEQVRARLADALRLTYDQQYPRREYREDWARRYRQRAVVIPLDILTRSA